MADSAMGAKLVRIRMREGKTGLFFATSPDLNGMLVAEKTVSELFRAIPRAIVAMYAACGEHVVVSPVENLTDNDKSWVAFPADVARRALDAEASRLG